MAMRMAFQHLEKLPDGFRFIADGYSAYLLAAQQFFHKFGENFKFDVTQVIGLTNEDAVSEEFRPYKQMIERLNRTYKALTALRTDPTITMVPAMTLPCGSHTITSCVRTHSITPIPPLKMTSSKMVITCPASGS